MIFACISVVSRGFAAILILKLECSDRFKIFSKIYRVPLTSAGKKFGDLGSRILAILLSGWFFSDY